MRRTRALPGSSSLKCRRLRKPFAISAFTAWSSPSTATSESTRPQEPSTHSTGTLRYLACARMSPSSENICDSSKCTPRQTSPKRSRSSWMRASLPVSTKTSSWPSSTRVRRSRLSGSTATRILVRGAGPIAVLHGGERGARVEVAPGAVRPLAFGAAHVARGMAPQDLDGFAFGIGTVDVHGDHAPAARLDRVLDRGRVIAAGAHLRHGARERADVGAQAGAERDDHHAELARSDPADGGADDRADHRAEPGADACGARAFARVRRIAAHRGHRVLSRGRDVERVHFAALEAVALELFQRGVGVDGFVEDPADDS